MITYWIEVSPNGEILHSCMSQSEAIPTPVRNGVIVSADNIYYPGKHAYQDGVVVSIGNAPDKFHRYDYAQRAWIDPRTLEELKSVKWAAMKAIRDSIEFGPFVYNNWEFDGDLDSQRRISGYISLSKSAIAAGEPFSAPFVLANNSVVTLTAQDFVAIELVKTQQIAAAFAQGNVLRSQIEAASTKEELEGITWPGV